MHILWATLTEFRTIGPYGLDWATEQYKCFMSQVITFSLLAALQAVNLFWLFLILRIMKNYLVSDVKADERSEDEDGDDEPVPTPVDKDTSVKLLLNGHPVDAPNGSPKEDKKDI